MPQRGSSASTATTGRPERRHEAPEPEETEATQEAEEKLERLVKEDRDLAIRLELEEELKAKELQLAVHEAQQAAVIEAQRVRNAQAEEIRRLRNEAADRAYRCTALSGERDALLLRREQKALQDRPQPSPSPPLAVMLSPLPCALARPLRAPAAQDSPPVE